MTPLTIIMNIEETRILPDVTRHEDYRKAFGKAEACGALPNGTSGGLATVYVAGHLPDGTPVILETTLKLLTAAVNALNSKHGG